MIEIGSRYYLDLKPKLMCLKFFSMWIVNLKRPVNSSSYKTNFSLLILKDGHFHANGCTDWNQTRDNNNQIGEKDSIGQLRCPCIRKFIQFKK